MKKYCFIFLSFFREQRGFTLVELLVVFSIIGILASISIVSFVDYSRNQELKAATSEVMMLLNQAKSKTQSQVKPKACGTNSLEGYEVRICGLIGSLCSASDTYELYARCGVVTTKLMSKKLAKNVSFSQTGTTSTTYFFRIMRRGVEGNGTISLNAFNKMQVISVNETGVISNQ